MSTTLWTGRTDSQPDSVQQFALTKDMENRASKQTCGLFENFQGKKRLILEKPKVKPFFALDPQMIWFYLKSNDELEKNSQGPLLAGDTFDVPIARTKLYPEERGLKGNQSRAIWPVPPESTGWCLPTFPALPECLSERPQQQSRAGRPALRGEEYSYSFHIPHLRALLRRNRTMEILLTFTPTPFSGYRNFSGSTCGAASIC